MALFDRVRERLSPSFDQMAEEASIRQLTAAQALREFMVDAIADIVRHLQLEDSASNAEKKAAAMRLCESFYDRVVLPLDLPGPDAVVDIVAKKFFLMAADYLIDSVIAFLKSVTLAPAAAAFRSE